MREEVLIVFGGRKQGVKGDGGGFFFVEMDSYAIALFSFDHLWVGREGGNSMGLILEARSPLFQKRLKGFSCRVLGVLHSAFDFSFLFSFFRIPFFGSVVWDGRDFEGPR